MSTAVETIDLSAPAADAGDRLSFTLFVAVVIHGLIILGINFKMPEATNTSQTIEITLATHKSLRAPDQADFLAQHNQEASGTEDTARQLTTERHAEFADSQVRDVNPIPQVAAASPNQKKEQDIITTTSNSSFKTELKKNPDPARGKTTARRLT